MQHAYNFCIVTIKLQQHQQVLCSSLHVTFSSQHAMHIAANDFHNIMYTIIYWMMCAIYGS